MFPSNIGGAAGSFGAMLFNLLDGALCGWYHSYGLVFVISGLLHPASFVLILLLVEPGPGLTIVTERFSFAAFDA